MKFELFGKLKKPIAAKPLPTELVKTMIDQGLPESEIIKNLRDQGYSFEEIDMTLNKAIGSEVTSKEMPVEEALPISLTNLSTEERKEEFVPFPQTEMPVEGAPFALTTEEIEETVESIIEEKITNIADIINDTNEKIKNLEKRINTIGVHVDEINRQLVNNQNELGKTIDEIQVKINDLNPKVLSLERAFKDVIPNLVEGVREVREIIKKKR